MLKLISEYAFGRIVIFALFVSELMTGKLCMNFCDISGTDERCHMQSLFRFWGWPFLIYFDFEDALYVYSFLKFKKNA